MNGVLLGFVTIGAVIAVGMLLAHTRVLDLGAQRTLTDVAFFVASPALMLTTLARADVGAVLTRNLLATVAGVVVAGGAYVAAARLVWHRDTGHTTVGALCSAYVNAGNLGIPIAAYVLGDAALVAPTLLLQLVVLQPVALAVLDADRRADAAGWRRTLTRPVRNPLTVGSLLGVLLAVTGMKLPDLLEAPLHLVGNLAVPAMLIAYGVALRLGPRPGRAGSVPELVTTSVLKVLVQPVVAWFVADVLLRVHGHALLAIVVTSALPTAQNVFVHATRYQRATVLARDTILITTASAVPVIVVATLLLH